MKLKIKGMVPAVFTPMLANGDINLEVVEEYAQYLSQHGIKDIFVLGTAGEGVNLSVKERKEVIEKWMEKAPKYGIENVILHVGSGNLPDSIELAQHGVKHGVSAVSTMAPYFFKPPTVSQLADRVESIANAVPDTPILFYHFPGLTDVRLNVKLLIDQMKSRGVKNFAGIKFTSTDMNEFGWCCAEYKDEYTMCYGYDEQAMAGLMLGADSCVGSTFNYCPGLYKRILDACKNGDVKVARENQYHSVRLISSLFSKGFNLGMNKALMQRVSGVDVGPVRAPLVAPTGEKMDEIMALLQDLGFHNYNF